MCRFARGSGERDTAERCANAAVHALSCAPDLSGSGGSPMTTMSAVLAAMPCRDLAAAWRVKVIAAGGPGPDRALQSWSRRC
jgi:hypothetical protein